MSFADHFFTEEIWRQSRYNAVKIEVKGLDSDRYLAPFWLLPMNVAWPEPIVRPVKSLFLFIYIISKGLSFYGWVSATPRSQCPSRKTTKWREPRSRRVRNLNVPLLTAKTINIHLFYFLQSIFLRGQIKKEKENNLLDSWMTRGWLVTWDWFGLVDG